MESLFKNPVQWFNNRNWFFRWLIVLTVIPATSTLSILSYQALSVPKATANTQVDIQKAIQADIQALQISQRAETAKLMKQIEELKQKREIEPQERQATKNASSSAESDEELLYLTNGKPEVSVYAHPDKLSAVVASFPNDSMHFYVDHQEGWYKIDLEGDAYGWVASDNAVEYP